MAVRAKAREEKWEVYRECHWCAGNVGRVALWGNIGLVALKLFCGVTGHSSALIADAFHSAADVVSAAIVWISLRLTKVPPDKDHPYGHGHMEYVAALAIGISLVGVAILIVVTCVAAIAKGVTTEPQLVALLGLVISIVGNELMYRHSYCAGKRFKSPAMIANAYENRADVYSSMAALVGVVGAQMGWRFMDPVGAIAVAVLILKSASDMLRRAWRGFADHSLEGPVEERIRDLAESDPQVREVVSLRSRAVGSYIVVDIGLSVAPELRLREGYAIAERVKVAVLEKVDSAGLITVRATGRKDEGGRMKDEDAKA